MFEFVMGLYLISTYITYENHLDLLILNLAYRKFLDSLVLLHMCKQFIFSIKSQDTLLQNISQIDYNNYKQ